VYVPVLRHARAVRGSGVEPVALDNRDALKRVGERLGRQQPGHAASDDHRATTRRHRGLTLSRSTGAITPDASTVKILSALISPDPSSGDIRLGGHDLATDPQAVRATIGVTGQFSAVDNLITGEENMLLMSDLHHLSKREGRRTAIDLLERFDLTDVAKKPASTYSGGMKRRLDLAMTLVGNPRIIFLDEPTTGLDPRSRHNMWQIIRELVSDGATVFLTTQYLEEADELADRIAVLNDGKIVAEGTAEALKRRVPGGHVRLRFTDPARYQGAAFALRDATRDDESLALQIPSDGSQRALRSILDRLDSADVDADTLTVHTPTSTTCSSP
jgi:ABC-2 type transport system ATP-binding protein